jgi:hypothetical protein
MTIADTRKGAGSAPSGLALQSANAHRTVTDALTSC